MQLLQTLPSSSVTQPLLTTSNPFAGFNVYTNARKAKKGRALVAHACNPSYSGGRDQEDHSSKPAWASISARPYIKKPFTKIGLVESLKVKALSSSPSTAKKEKI
jgi:hypothetical protein